MLVQEFFINHYLQDKQVKVIRIPSFIVQETEAPRV